mmetsp:Transcript_3922/g.3211  ORF Transcript_3922/g.3211 Transcript_3922/m.3211 type:complete len:90 (-) Transcript_3922:59-328(-)
MLSGIIKDIRGHLELVVQCKLEIEPRWGSEDKVAKIGAIISTVPPSRPSRGRYDERHKADLWNGFEPVLAWVSTGSNILWALPLSLPGY